ncbi:MAG TPA: NAD(P)H-hydrate epimerase [Candidatus Binatia bacterium]|nr:NAD(P)H-hydrate epimerase [Candidatus Binatia bacterium]
MAEPISITANRWQLPDIPIAKDLVPAVDTPTMLAADRIATDRIGISLLQMMENAGLQLAELTRLTLGGVVAGRRIVVLAGTGNNAGGGMAAARRLAGWGADVCVIFARPLLRLRPAPCAQVEPMLAAGVRAAVAGHDRSHPEIAAEIVRSDAVIDALIGYTLHGPPDEVYQPLIGVATLGTGPVISLDIPSGIDASTGARPGSAISADATLALALPKRGMTLGEGRRFSGAGFLADIGLPASIFEELGIRAGKWFAHGPLVRLS